jgi:hypothetical protein
MYKLSINHVCKETFQNILALLYFTTQVCWVINKFIILQKKVSLGDGILPSLGSHDEGLVFDGVKWQRARNQLNKSG